MSESGIVRIHGREYATVAHRVHEFRQQYGIDNGWAIKTKIVSIDSERVVVQAAIVFDGKVLATGLAEEVRAASKINRTSALENCETSAIGRALAAAGYLGGTEYATAHEVSQAIEQQAPKPKPKPKQDAYAAAVAFLRGLESLPEIVEAMLRIRNSDKLTDTEISRALAQSYRCWISLAQDAEEYRQASDILEKDEANGLIDSFTATEILKELNLGMDGGLRGQQKV